jgi:ribose transport system ATP-binding protein
VTAARVLAVENVSRRFGPVQVLFDVNFDLRPGEVHALIGENGAGKSTTMKIMGGYLQPTSGRVLLDGEEVHFASSREAEDRGVVMIHQEFNLASQLTVEENIFLGRELRRGLFLDHRAMRAESRRLLARLNCTVDPRARVSDISVPNRQMVEIAKALGRHARVLIMDEPTAVLTARETDTLLELIARLRAEGTAILYTSHKLDEVSRIADRVTNVCERTAFVITGDPRALPGKVDPD